MLRQQAKLVAFFSMLFDALLVCLSFVLAYMLRRTLKLESLPLGELGMIRQYYWVVLAALPIWLVLMRHFRLYDSLRTRSYLYVLWSVLRASVLGLLLLGFAVLFLDREHFSRSLLLLFGACAFAVLSAGKLAIRLFLISVRRRGFNFRNVLVVGTDQSARRCVEMLHEHNGWGLRPVGYLEGFCSDTLTDLNVKPLGHISDISGVLEGHVVDEVFFAVPTEHIRDIEPAVRKCEELGVKVHVAAELFESTESQTHLEEFCGMPVITLTRVPHHAGQLLVKRVIDLVVSAVVLIALSPLLLIFAVAIKLTSRGPVFFRQVRSGRNRRQFNLLKFRTMRRDADSRLKELKPYNEMDGPVFKMKDDPRVTRVGRFLRKLSLDELPQLINVLKGDMSLVGPRPPIPDEVSKYERWQMRRLSMKPGLTCLWQVSGRNRIDFENWMKLDLKYIDNWSLWLDMWILLRTIPAVLFARGAS
jgi:exopolysaccharide biosynthesis polyprenyl glycosylphosphotransferase